MSAPIELDIDQLIDNSRSERDGVAKGRARLALGVSVGVTVCWLIYVTVSGQWGRVGDQWTSAVTMIFGSFVAGSTPQGGGAVAFPVFTKLLEVPSEVARTFSLSIQSIGMTAASLGILINRRRVDFRAIAIAAPASIVGFLIGYVVLTESDQPFGPSILPGAYVKVTFTVLVAAMAFVTYVGYRIQLIEQRSQIPVGNQRVTATIASCAFVGGIASVLVGSGADVLVYLAVVSLVGLSPRVGVATSVIVMTIVSLVGLVVFAIGEGYLSTSLGDAGASVLAVDGDSVRLVSGRLAFGLTGELAPSSRFDLFGLWLAAVPVVAWGAPLGSAVSARVTDRQLVKFVITLALIEFVSTLIFLEELRTNPALAIFGAVAMVVTLGGLWLLTKNRQTILNLPKVDPNQSVVRGAVDVGPRAKQQLEEK